MTEHTDASERSSGAADASNEQTANSMGDVDHTHPHRNTTFGSIFGRGPTVAADGGAPASATTVDESMADVDHESPTGTDPSGVFDRGRESTTPPSSAVDQGGVATDE